MAYRNLLTATSMIGWLFFGADAYAKTMEELVNYACETHPSISAANINILQADTSIAEAKALFLPTISSVSEVGVADDEQDQGLGVSGTRPYSTQLILDQPIYIGGSAGVEVKAAKLAKNRLRYQGISQVIDVQSRAVFAYIELGRTLSVFRVRQDNLKSLQDQKTDAERRFELGGGTKSNIVEVSSRIARAQGNLISAKADVNQAKYSLGEVVGQAVTSSIERPGLSTVVTSFQEATSRALAYNPQIQAADQDTRIADVGVERTKSDRRPRLRLLGQLNAQRDTNFFGFERDEARLSLRLDVPIFEGGRLAAREKGALHEASSARFNRLTLTRLVIEQLQTEWEALQETKLLIDVNEDLVAASMEALEAIKREAFEGFRPNRDVLDAQQEVLEARLSLEQSRFALTDASFRLQFAVGEVDESRFPSCAEAVVLSPEKDAEEAGGGYKLRLPIIGDLIGGENKRRDRGPPNRR